MAPCVGAAPALLFSGRQQCQCAFRAGGEGGGEGGGGDGDGGEGAGAPPSGQNSCGHLPPVQHPAASQPERSLRHNAECVRVPELPGALQSGPTSPPAATPHTRAAARAAAATPAAIADDGDATAPTNSASVGEGGGGEGGGEGGSGEGGGGDGATAAATVGPSTARLAARATRHVATHPAAAGGLVFTARTAGALGPVPFTHPSCE